jgi:hypothetical protein
VFDFELTKDDMDKIKALDTGSSLFFNHQAASTVDFFIELIRKRREIPQ